MMTEYTHLYLQNTIIVFRHRDHALPRYKVASVTVKGEEITLAPVFDDCGEKEMRTLVQMALVYKDPEIAAIWLAGRGY